MDGEIEDRFHGDLDFQTFTSKLKSLLLRVEKDGEGEKLVGDANVIRILSNRWKKVSRFHKKRVLEKVRYSSVLRRLDVCERIIWYRMLRIFESSLSIHPSSLGFWSSVHARGIACIDRLGSPYGDMYIGGEHSAVQSVRGLEVEKAMVKTPSPLSPDFPFSKDYHSHFLSVTPHDAYEGAIIPQECADDLARLHLEAMLYAYTSFWQYPQPARDEIIALECSGDYPKWSLCNKFEEMAAVDGSEERRFELRRDVYLPWKHSKDGLRTDSVKYLSSNGCWGRSPFLVYMLSELDLEGVNVNYSSPKYKGREGTPWMIFSLSLSLYLQAICSVLLSPEEEKSLTVSAEETAWETSLSLSLSTWEKSLFARRTHSLEIKCTGNTAYKHGKAQEAIVHYTRGLISDPVNHVILLNRAAAWLGMKMSGRARVDLELFLAEGPHHYHDLSRDYYQKAFYRLGLSYDMDGDTENALSAFRSAVRCTSGQTVPGGVRSAYYTTLSKLYKSLPAPLKPLLIHPYGQLIRVPENCTTGGTSISLTKRQLHALNSRGDYIMENGRHLCGYFAAHNLVHEYLAEHENEPGPKEIDMRILTLEDCDVRNLLMCCYGLYSKTRGCNLPPILSEVFGDVSACSLSVDRVFLEFHMQSSGGIVAMAKNILLLVCLYKGNGVMDGENEANEFWNNILFVCIWTSLRVSEHVRNSINTLLDDLILHSSSLSTFSSRFPFLSLHQSLSLSPSPGKDKEREREKGRERERERESGRLLAELRRVWTAWRYVYTAPEYIWREMEAREEECRERLKNMKKEKRYSIAEENKLNDLLHWLQYGYYAYDTSLSFSAAEKERFHRRFVPSTDPRDAAGSTGVYRDRRILQAAQGNLPVSCRKVGHEVNTSVTGRLMSDSDLINIGEFPPKIGSVFDHIESFDSDESSKDEKATSAQNTRGGNTAEKEGEEKVYFDRNGCELTISREKSKPDWIYRHGAQCINPTMLDPFAEILRVPMDGPLENFPGCELPNVRSQIQGKTFDILLSLLSPLLSILRSALGRDIYNLSMADYSASHRVCIHSIHMWEGDALQHAELSWKPHGVYFDSIYTGNYGNDIGVINTYLSLFPLLKVNASSSLAVAVGANGSNAASEYLYRNLHFDQEMFTSILLGECEQETTEYEMCSLEHLFLRFSGEMIDKLFSEGQKRKENAKKLKSPTKGMNQRERERYYREKREREREIQVTDVDLVTVEESVTESLLFEDSTISTLFELHCHPRPYIPPLQNHPFHPFSPSTGRAPQENAGKGVAKGVAKGVNPVYGVGGVLLWIKSVYEWGERRKREREIRNALRREDYEYDFESRINHAGDMLSVINSLLFPDFHSVRLYELQSHSLTALYKSHDPLFQFFYAKNSEIFEEDMEMDEPPTDVGMYWGMLNALGNANETNSGEKPNDNVTIRMGNASSGTFPVGVTIALLLCSKTFYNEQIVITHGKQLLANIDTASPSELQVYIGAPFDPSTMEISLSLSDSWVRKKSASWVVVLVNVTTMTVLSKPLPVKELLKLG